MAEQGATTSSGKILTDEQGRPIRLEGEEPAARALGFRPARMGRISGEHQTMQNVKAYFNDKRDDLYARYRFAKTAEDKQKVIRDMQRFNMDARKYRGVIPPIMTTSLHQGALQKPEKPFMAFGRMIEASP